MKWATFIFMLLVTTAIANDTMTRISRSVELVNESMTYLSGLSYGPNAVCLAQNSADYESPALSGSQMKCLETYENFYADEDGDGIVNMDVYLGYADMDNHSNVIDPINRLALVSAVLKMPCPPNVHVCGFSATDDAEVYTKVVTAPSGEQKTVQVRIRDSAVGLSNQENTTTMREAQTAKSARVRGQFKESIRESEAVFYLGHSRYGGGPDFSPPQLLPNGQSNSAYYQSRRTGLGDIVENMNQPPSNMKYLGLLSCNSDRHFKNSIRMRNRNLGLTTTSQSAGDNHMIPALLGNLNSLIGMECQNELRESIDIRHDNVMQQSGFF